jgi:hypothetical protein
MSDIFINLPIHHNNLLLVHILEESKTIVCQMDAVMQSEYNMSTISENRVLSRQEHEKYTNRSIRYHRGHENKLRLLTVI